MPAVLPVWEARRVPNASEQHSNTRLAFRNRAIIAIFLFWGLRRSEHVVIGVDDADLRSRWLRVRKGNCGKGRSVALLDEAAEADADWLEFHPDADHEGLFVGRQGERLGVGVVAKVFEKTAAKANVDREGVSLYTLRHTVASLLVQEGCDLVSIQELLGHVDLASTSIYLHLDIASA